MKPIARWLIGFYTARNRLEISKKAVSDIHRDVIDGFFSETLSDAFDDIFDETFIESTTDTWSETSNETENETVNDLPTDHIKKTPLKPKPQGRKEK